MHPAAADVSGYGHAVATAEHRLYVWGGEPCRQGPRRSPTSGPAYRPDSAFGFREKGRSMRASLFVLKRAAVVVLLAALPTPSRGADFALVRAGKCPEEIVIGAQAPTMVRYAAQELGDYLVKICGSRPALVQADEHWQLPPGEARRVFIGESAFTRGMGIVPTALKPDGFIVAADEKNLVLVGRDEPVPYVENRQAIMGLGFETLFVNEPAKLCAYGQTGSLFAVYHVLEKDAGVRWVWPGELGEEIPASNEVKVAGGQRQVEPAFAYRQYYGFKFADDLAAAQWYRRAGFGSTTDPMWPNHSAYSIYGNPENFKNHPEWFAVHNGVRHPVDLCWSEPGLVDEWVRLAREFFHTYPDATMFRVMPEDGTGVCECPRCQAKVDWSPPQEGAGPLGGNALLGNLLWPVINEIAQRVRKELPDKYIGCCAYANYLKPPFQVEKIEPNVVVMFCAMTPAMWAGSGYDAGMEQFEKGWAAKGVKVFANWDYMNAHVFVTGGNNGLYTPFVIPHLLGKRYSRLKGVSRGAFLEAENLPGLGLQSLSHYGMDHVNWYVLGKLCWDPAVDVDAVLDDYCRAFFGPAAASMRRFWDIQETRWVARRDLLAWDEAPTRWNHVYTPAALREMFQALDEARGLAQALPEKRYLKRLELIAGEYAILRSCLVDEWDAAAARPLLAGNGGFEEGDSPVPAQWVATDGCRVAQDEKLSGQRSVRLEGNEAVLCGEPLRLNPEHDYRFAVWFKTQGNGNPDAAQAWPRLSVVNPGAAGQPVASVVPAPATIVATTVARPGNVRDWQRLYVICKPGALACVRLQGAQGYSCWFDEVTVEEFPADWQRRACGFPSYP